MTRVKRILYTAFDIVPSPKGASTHITHVVRGLSGAGFNVHLLTPGDGILPATDSYAGASVERTPPLDGANFLTRASAYADAVEAHANSHSYDVGHYRSIWGGLQLAQLRAQRGYRTLFEVNGLPSIELKYHYPALHSSASAEAAALLAKIREQELAILALSDHIICPSDVTRAFLGSLGVPRQRITVIPNGVDIEVFRPTPLPQHDLPTVLYIGTLADWQGLEVLISALPKVLMLRPIKLRIVGRGRGRQRKQLAKLIQKLGLAAHVSIEAPVPHHEIPALLATADICVAPLALNDRNVTQGCCPIKVLEYMAAGRPLVAANLPVVRELAREDVDALLFAPGDADDLARQLLRLLDDRQLAQQLATTAAERARERFTWRHAQKRLLRVYEGF